MTIVGTVLILMYATTFSSDNLGIFLSAVLFMVVGLVFAQLWVGIKLEPFRLSQFVITLIWTIISVASIYLVNKLVPMRALPISQRMFVVLMGIAEEIFFRLWLVPFIHRMTRSTLLAVGVSSLIWAVYHISRYGGSINSLFVVLMAGLPLGFALLATKQPDSSIFAHAVVNYLAFQSV